MCQIASPCTTSVGIPLASRHLGVRHLLESHWPAAILSARDDGWPVGFQQHHITHYHITPHRCASPLRTQVSLPCRCARMAPSPLGWLAACAQRTISHHIAPYHSLCRCSCDAAPSLTPGGAIAYDLTPHRITVRLLITPRTSHHTTVPPSLCRCPCNGAVPVRVPHPRGRGRHVLRCWPGHLPVWHLLHVCA